MDVDLLKSSSTSSVAVDHNLDMMTMRMQIEKPLEFYDHYSPNTPTYQQINFSGKTNYTTNNLSNTATLPIFHNTNVALFSSSSSQFMNPSSSSVSFMKNSDAYENKNNSMVAMREMIFRIASMQPIYIDPESIKPPKRKNVKISKDPQSIAARHRRERISERIRILQTLVPGGTKMDTASMLDEAIHYVKFLKKQIQNLEQAGATNG